MLSRSGIKQAAAIAKDSGGRIKAADIERVARMAERRLVEHGVRPKSRQTCRAILYVPFGERGHRAIALKRDARRWSVSHVNSDHATRPLGGSRMWWVSLCEVAIVDVCRAVEVPSRV